MRLLITLLIVGVVFSVIAALITPPDIISQLTVMFEMFVIYGVIFFAVSRFKSFKQTPESMRTMIAAMACLLSIATVFSYMLYVRCRHLSNERYEYAIQQDPNDILGQ